MDGKKTLWNRKQNEELWLQSKHFVKKDSQPFDRMSYIFFAIPLKTVREEKFESHLPLIILSRIEVKGPSGFQMKTHK